jgi:hypothetical protein
LVASASRGTTRYHRKSRVCTEYSRTPEDGGKVPDGEEIRTPGVPSGKNSVSALVGVPIIDKTLRLNPMTMDEGYISTLTYIELINHFKLLPSSRLPLFGEYAKVVYRFVDEKDQWAQAVSPTDGRPLETIVAGLHLANFHPLKYLKEIDSDEAKILCIARSRYNVLNKVERLKSMFGKPIDENRREVFSSSDVKTEKTAPFRVEIKWAKKTSAEKEAAKPDEETKNAALLKELLVKVYSAPVRLRGKELYDELKSSLDLPQLFRFMALNRILENGDISDEYFWYVEKKEKTGKVSLGIMPQDGDDMFKGAHFFPTSPKQIGLIINSSGLAKKLKLGFGYIMNYEDPLFRVTQDDPYLFYQYLLVFEQVAGEIANSPVLEKILGRISTKIEPFSRDPEVLARGKTDERGREYSPESFIENIGRLKLKIRENAAKSFARLHGSAKDRGDLDRAKGAVGKF